MLWICCGDLLVIVVGICLTLPIHSVSAVRAHHVDGVATRSILMGAVGVAALGRRAIIERICSIEGRWTILVVIIVRYGTCVKMASLLIRIVLLVIFIDLRSRRLDPIAARTNRGGS